MGEGAAHCPSGTPGPPGALGWDGGVLMPCCNSPFFFLRETWGSTLGLGGPLKGGA